jgi:hypothetical protein
MRDFPDMEARIIYDLLWYLPPPTPIAVANMLHVPMNDLDDWTSRHSSASLVFVTTSLFRWELVASPWAPSLMYSNYRPSQQIR